MLGSALFLALGPAGMRLRRPKDYQTLFPYRQKLNAFCGA